MSAGLLEVERTLIADEVRALSTVPPCGTNAGLPTTEDAPLPRMGALGSTALAVAYAYPALIACASLAWARPAINPDTSAALLAWNGFLQTGHWNQIVAPAQLDLSRDSLSWLSWWSPGQYLLTGLFALALPNLGWALVFSALAACWIKSTGLLRMLRAFGIGPVESALIVAVEATSWNLFYGFGFYCGAELAQAAYFPWLVLAVFRLTEQPPSWRWLGLGVLFFVGSAVKYSMEIANLALSGWVLLRLLRDDRAGYRAKFFGPVLVGAAVSVMLLGTRFLLVRGSVDPASASGSAMPVALALGYPLWGALLSATGAASIVTHHFFAAGRDTIEGWNLLAPVILVTSPVAIGIYVLACRGSKASELRLLCACFIAGYAACLMALFLRHAAVGADDRHFRLPGILLLGCLTLSAIELRGQRRRFARMVAGLICMGSVLYGTLAGVIRISTIHKLDRVASCGVTMPDLDRSADARLREIGSRQDPGSVVFVADPRLSAELSGCRLIASDVAAAPVRLDSIHYQGRVRSLTLVVPASWSGGRALERLESDFVDYSIREWRADTVGNYCFVHAGVP